MSSICLLHKSRHSRKRLEDVCDEKYVQTGTISVVIVYNE